MIIVKLKGGIGNQMFQYAFGRRIALESNSVLKFDISNFKNDIVYQRKFGLGCFNIEENFANMKDLKKAKFFKSSKSIGKLVRRLYSFIPLHKRYVLSEKKLFVFNPKAIRKYKSVYIDGYWQNEKYFHEIEEVIRNNFRFKDFLNNKNLNLANKIQNSNSVAIHIRKYNDIEDASMHTLSLDYYYNAIDYFIGKCFDPHFFIFSDNMGWTKKNLKLPYNTTYVEKNKDYEDLRLMSLCKHQIIANSSFSWWAAWLNNNPHKIIIAPNIWFKENKYDTSDFIPSNWIRT